MPGERTLSSGGRMAAKGYSLVKVSVMYVGQPADPAAFDAYYWGTHLPTVKKWPRIRRITVAKGTGRRVLPDRRSPVRLASGP